MSDDVEPIAEQLQAAQAKLAEMEKTYGWLISEWAEVYAEKLRLERQLSAGLGVKRKP